MEKIKARIWFGESNKERKKVGKKVRLVTRKPDKYLLVNYEEGGFDNALGEMRRKVEGAVKGNSPYGVLIFST